MWLLSSIFALKGSLRLLIGLIVIEGMQFMYLLFVRVIVDLRRLLRDLKVLPSKFDKVRVATLFKLLQVNCFLIQVFVWRVIVHY